jgi:DNA polymerase
MMATASRWVSNYMSAVRTDDVTHPAREARSRGAGLPSLAKAADGCRACPLYANATNVVFGKGGKGASLMLVGEQPGDKEDLAGEPFVGPAGRELDAALERAGIDRSQAYVTNAVKHFKWKAGRGKRRLHQSPNAEEVRACRPWLEAELEVVRPKIVVALGATAAKSLFGSKFKVMRDHGTPVEVEFAPAATGTIHPSAILRLDDPDRTDAREMLTADLAAAKEIASSM